ncbi:hypothetical protein BDZ89DRAFT_1065621 [Hymenopellis radicata]|nr:hypothetical protein BDZ89DRAFT_1065621 [Hymenopellis radicata]
MSNDVAALRDVHAHNSLQFFAISFLYWDHLITLGRECEHLWRQAGNTSAQLFFLNRYLAFLGNISITVLAFTDLSNSSCQKFNLYRQVLLIVTQVIVCVLLTIRIYALYGCSRRVLVYMFASGVVLGGVSCWSLFSQGHVDHPMEYWTGCHIGLDRHTARRIASAWEALFIYDSILFTLTILKTRRREPSDVIALLVRDGAIYFAVTAIANFMNILTFYIARPFLRGGLSTFSSCVSVTMMSRLMLNLHENARLEPVGTSTWITFGRLDITQPEESLDEDEISIGLDTDTDTEGTMVVV